MGLAVCSSSPAEGQGLVPTSRAQKSQRAARLAEQCCAVDVLSFNGLVGFVWKQGRTPSAGISVTSGSLRSSKRAPLPRTGSRGRQRSGSWSAAQTTSGGAGATSVRISTAAPRFRSRRKGPERSRSPRRPRRRLQNRPCWSAGLLAWNCWLTEPRPPGLVPSPAPSALLPRLTTCSGFHPQYYVVTLCNSIVCFLLEVVYCPSRNFEVIAWETNPEDLRCCLAEAEGEKWVESAFLASLGSEHGDTLCKLEPGPGMLRSLWGTGPLFVLGAGPKSVATVTQMGWFVVHLRHLKRPVEKTFLFWFFKLPTIFVRVAALTLK